VTSTLDSSADDSSVANAVARYEVANRRKRSRHMRAFRALRVSRSRDREARAE
jgi:hypothetical protein